MLEAPSGHRGVLLPLVHWLHPVPQMRSQLMQSSLTSTFQGLPEHIQQGAIIGQRFRVDSVIAEGGMGVVYKGWHLVLEHPIAIKVMRAEFASDPEAVTRFLKRGPVVPSIAPSDSPRESILIAPSPSPCPTASTVGSSAEASSGLDTRIEKTAPVVASNQPKAAPPPSEHSRTPDAKTRRVLPAVQLGEEPMPDPPNKDYDPGI